MRLLAFALLLPLAAALGGCGLEFAAGAVAGGVAGHEMTEKHAGAEPAKAAPEEKPAAEKEAAEKATAEKAAREKPTPAKTAAIVPVPQPLPPQRKEAAPPAADDGSVSPENRQMFEDFLKSRDGEPPR